LLILMRAATSFICCSVRTIRLGLQRKTRKIRKVHQFGITASGPACWGARMESLLSLYFSRSIVIIYLLSVLSL
jgi:hypothetical protein